MDDNSKVYLHLKVQTARYRAEHGTKATLWMLDCKVLLACQEWITEWNKNPKAMIESVKKFSSPLMIIEEAYHILVNRKAIEKIPEGTDLEKLTEELFGPQDDKRIFARQCKMIYLFSQLPVKINLE